MLSTLSAYTLYWFKQIVVVSGGGGGGGGGEEEEDNWLTTHLVHDIDR